MITYKGASKSVMSMKSTESGIIYQRNKKAIHVFRSQMLGTGLIDIILEERIQERLLTKSSPQSEGHWGHSCRCWPPSQARACRRERPILPIQFLFPITLAVGFIGIFHVHANSDTFLWFQQNLSAPMPLSELKFLQGGNQVLRQCRSVRWVLPNWFPTHWR